MSTESEKPTEADRVLAGHELVDSVAEHAARGSRINDHGVFVSDYDSAFKEYKRWLKGLPPIDTAYAPSGKVSGSNRLRVFAFGLPIVAFLSYVVLFLVNSLCFLVLRFIWGLMVMATAFIVGNESGVASIFIATGDIISGIIAGGLAGAAGGMTAEWVSGIASRYFFNRNSALASVCALAGCALAWAAILVGYVGLVLPASLRAAQLDAGVWVLIVSNFINTGLMALAAYVVVSGQSQVALKKHPFCEKCEKYLVRQPPKNGLSHAAGLNSICMLAKGEISQFAVASDNEKGGRVHFESLRCPVCGGGILEATVHFKAKYPNKEKAGTFEEFSHSWLVASKLCDRDVLECLCARVETL